MLDMILSVRVIASDKTASSAGDDPTLDPESSRAVDAAIKSTGNSGNLTGIHISAIIEICA